MKSYVRSKRPLSYLGNSDRTKRRKKKIGMLDAEKNGNTLDRFLSTEKNIQINEESNAIENNLILVQLSAQVGPFTVGICCRHIREGTLGPALTRDLLRS